MRSDPPAVPFHVGIATPDVEASMAALTALLGLTWVALDRPPICHYTPGGAIQPSPRVMYSAQGPLYIELIEAAEGTFYPLTEPTHLHHVGYWTDDFATALASAENEGWALEVSMRDDGGRPTTFAYLSRPGDVRIELVDSVGRNALETLLKAALEGEAQKTERHEGRGVTLKR